jgi:hypothetical protein
VIENPNPNIYVVNNLDRLVIEQPQARGIPTVYEVGIVHEHGIPPWQKLEPVARFYGSTATEALTRAQAALPGLGEVADRVAGVRCERCGKVIKRKAMWLELNCTTGEWTTPDKPWPEAESQGAFPFGSECVKPALLGREYKGVKQG